MNIVTTNGKPSTPFPAIGNVFSTKAYISVISQQISEAEEIKSHIKYLMHEFPIRTAWKIYWSTKRFCKRKLEEKRLEQLEAYHIWLQKNL